MTIEFDTPNMPAMADGKTAIGQDFFNPIHRRIDVRIHALEGVKASWEEAVEILTTQGLRRIDTALLPSVEQIAAKIAALDAMIASAAEALQEGAENALDAIQPQIDAKLASVDLALAGIEDELLVVAAVIASAQSAANNANAAAASITDIRTGRAMLVSASAVLSVGERVCVDSSGAARTMTLPPAPEFGHHVTVWRTGANPVTLARNGSTIEGLAEDLVIDVTGKGVRLTYLFGTWKAFPPEMLI